MLELAIALETLLVDSPGENTFKVSLRSALVASEGIESRIADRAMIAAAYGLRSALMHSGQSPDVASVRGAGRVPATEIASRSIEIALTVVRRVLTAGRLPEWSELELSGLV